MDLSIVSAEPRASGRGSAREQVIGQIGGQAGLFGLPVRPMG
jgi:hypothetical protein